MTQFFTTTLGKLGTAQCAVAGASGFLGRRLAELLLAEAAAVRAIVRPSSRVELPESVEVARPRFADRGELTAALRGVSIVFNCIGESSDWGPWARFCDGNVDTVRQLLEAAACAGVRCIVHVSTTDVYGYPKIPCDESHPLIDVGLPYNRTKIVGDQLARQLGRELGLAVTVVRPATIFGPRSHDWVEELGRQLRARNVPMLDGGRTNAGLVYVDDVALSMMALAARDEGGGEVYNLVDPEPIAWRAYFAALCEVLNVPPPRIDIPSPVAFAAAWCSEAVAKAVRSERRPLFTRHVAYVMCRDQHYASERVRRAVAGFPRVGLRRGLELTKEWLSRRDWLD